MEAWIQTEIQIVSWSQGNGKEFLWKEQKELCERKKEFLWVLISWATLGYTWLLTDSIFRWSGPQSSVLSTSQTVVCKTMLVWLSPKFQGARCARQFFWNLVLFWNGSACVNFLKYGLYEATLWSTFVLNWSPSGFYSKVRVRVSAVVQIPEAGPVYLPVTGFLLSFLFIILWL